MPNGDGDFREWKGETDHRLDTVEGQQEKHDRALVKIFDRMRTMEIRMAFYVGAAVAIVKVADRLLP